MANTKNIPEIGPEEMEAMNFEVALEKLEGIVRKLEAGEVGLDESLRLFEQGVALSRVCAALLNKAEARIRVLTTGDDGEPEEKPFDIDLPGAASS